MKSRKIEQNARKAAEEIEELSNKEYLRSGDITRLFSISNSTLKNLRQAKAIPFYKLGGTFLYKREEIIAYIERNKVGR